jgi:adenylate cyclase
MIVDLASEVNRLLQHGGLAFANARDEADFTHSYVLGTARITQIFLFIGAFTYASYYVWDDIVDPAHQHLALMIRLLFVAPILFACSFALNFKTGRAYLEQIMIVAGVSLFFAQAWIYTILDAGFTYVALGFVLTYLGLASAFTVRFLYLVILAFAALLAAVGGHFIANNAPPGWLVINSLGTTAAVSLGLVSAYVRERAARQQFVTDRALAKSLARADELLHSILPGNIVERIQDGETGIADSLGDVSIVFADLAGFTSLSRRLSPPDLIRLLDDMFSRFDRAAALHNIDKINTIGDAYLAVGGISGKTECDDHAQNAALFALAIQDVVRKLVNETGYPVNLRIGLHVGPIIAGVVGERRPTYDCFGEAVSVASGLENRAPPGGILISDSAYERLRHRFAISELRHIELKGITGRNKVRLLLGPLANDVDGPDYPQSLPRSSMLDA